MIEKQYPPNKFRKIFIFPELTRLTAAVKYIQKDVFNVLFQFLDRANVLMNRLYLGKP